jgi:hypothetical protein
MTARLEESEWRKKLFDFQPSDTINENRHVGAFILISNRD